MLRERPQVILRVTHRISDGRDGKSGDEAGWVGVGRMEASLSGDGVAEDARVAHLDGACDVGGELLSERRVEVCIRMVGVEYVLDVADELVPKRHWPERAKRWQGSAEANALREATAGAADR
jgi:hypothetical protein